MLHELSTPLGKELLLLFLPRNSVRPEETPQDIKLFSLVLNTRTNKIATFPTRLVSSPCEGKGGDFLIEKWGDFLGPKYFRTSCRPKLNTLEIPINI